MIRKRSERVVTLKEWRDPTTTTSFVPLSAYSRTTPPHPILLDLQLRQDGGSVSSSTYDEAINICKTYHDEFGRHDLMFVLEIIQDYSTSQQQFWESISILARSASVRMSKIGGQEQQLWDRTLASAVLGIYLKQNQRKFLCQVEALAHNSVSLWSLGLTAEEQLLDSSTPASEAKFLSFTVLDSLLLMHNKKRAIDLFESLEKDNIPLPSRFITSFVRIAVSQFDGYLLERIGNLLLENEKFFQECPYDDDAVDLLSRTRPMHLSSKVMDSFIHGACECELYELARDVFYKALDAGQKYRVSTYNKILNSYSVKGFGFDIVAAAEAESRRARRRRNSSCSKIDVSGTVLNKEHSMESESSSLASAKAIAVADPSDVAKCVMAMKDQGVVPNMVTLNVLVKLYLEMAQYKVPEAPHWKTAFKTYNPSKLRPDLVTNNTLLAYYEKHKDLSTMKRIYDSMAGVPTTVQLSDRERRLQAKAALEDSAKGQPQDDNEQKEQQSLQQIRHTRSNRDIYTYNTMLHALLQHAVESKDIASIGQCFYDMEQDGLTADTVTFNTNILYHITGGNLSSAIQVFRSMERTVKKQAKTLSEQDADPLMDPQLARTLSRPVKSVPTYIRLSRPSHDTSSPTTDSATAPDATLSSPTATDPVPAPAPDVVTLTSLISGFGHANQMKKATQYFKEMTEHYKIQPNLKTYSTIVAGLHRAGNHQKAEKLWDIVLEEDNPTSQNQPLTLGGKSGIDEDDMEQEPLRTLTIMERRQVEARRKLYRDSLEG
jgi:pentatricopeptide repeat protein